MTTTGRQRGFSYVEVLVSTLLIATALVPALDALQTGIQASAIHQDSAETHALLMGKLEQILSEPFSQLSEQASIASNIDSIVGALSDAPGSSNRRLVYLAHFDGEAQAYSGIETGLLWVRVALEKNGDRLETLTAK